MSARSSQKGNGMRKDLAARLKALEGSAHARETVFYWKGARANALAAFWQTHDKVKHPENSLDFLEFSWVGDAR